MRVGIIGASHWHVAVYYLPLLAKSGVEIVGLADPDPAALQRLDPEGHYAHYLDYFQLLKEQHPDLIFAHAPHDEMTALAADLVGRGQPFHIEKPAGLDWHQLSPVAEQARAAGLFNSVALVTRYMPVVEALGQLRDEQKLGCPLHYYYRLFSGPPQRYREWGVDWMLDPARAGAGPLFNFGPHAVDLFLHLCGEPVVEVSCWTTHALHHEKVEDLASLQMRTASGARGIAEVGYVLPEGYERYFSLTTDTLYYGGPLVGGTILLRDGSAVPVAGPEADEAYELYTADVLRRFVAGEPARADLTDMTAALRVLNAAQESVQRGQPVQLL